MLIGLGVGDQIRRTWHSLQWRRRWPGVPPCTGAGLWCRWGQVEEHQVLSSRPASSHPVSQ